MITPCPEPNKEGCPWVDRPGGCFADTDHIVPRFLARRVGDGVGKMIARKYVDLPENKQQLCRYEHDQKSAEELETPPELPELEVMKAAIKQRRRRR